MFLGKRDSFTYNIYLSYTYHIQIDSSYVFQEHMYLYLYVLVFLCICASAHLHNRISHTYLQKGKYSQRTTQCCNLNVSRKEDEVNDKQLFSPNF